MPYKKRKKSDGTYEVSSPSGKKSKGTTKEKAESQIRLLNTIEHGFVPDKPTRSTGKKKNIVKKVKSSRAQY